MSHSKSLLTFLVMFNSLFVFAQTDSTNSMKVYLNCGWCYQDYLRTQITWVNFVQDQFVSDVDLMITTMGTGSGGREYQLVFNGKGAMTGMHDTIKFAVSVIQTENEQRELLMRKVKLGLVRYAACSATGDCLVIDSDNSKDSLDVGIGSNPDEDPWNAWVFRIGANANVNAQKVFQSGDAGISFRSSQVKETHKFAFNARADYSEQRYSYGGLNSTFILRAQSADAHYVHSLSEHWSAGGFAYAERSDFRNYDYFQSVAGAVEYDIVPYKEAQTRAITLAYRAGYSFYDFQELTIYNKTKDAIPFHAFNASASFTQDWGDFSAGFEAAAFINDFEKNHFNFWLSNSVRIFKGLSMSTYLSYNVQRDQVNIRLNGASEEEVLLQQQELQTNYNFYAYVSVGYRFGSIYNNVVNPRFNL